VDAFRHNVVANLSIFGCLNRNCVNVVITGGTKGIGKAICELLFEKGANLAICSRSENDLEQFRNELIANDDERRDVFVQRADISQKKDVDSFAKAVLERWDQIDVLINNAGLFIPGEICNEEDGALQKMIDTNLFSAYHLSRALINQFLRQKKGHIINMCSIASLGAYPNGGSYSISKFAMLGFSKVLREELKGKGIRVTSILPGSTWSHSWEGVDLPKERLMPAHDIALVVANAIELSPAAVVEEIIIRPQLGDL
jgi:short-subunit dehydrogenase